MSHLVRIGVIGAGGIARSAHIPNYQKVPNCEVVAISDVIDNAAHGTAAQFGVAHCYNDFREMLKRDDLDAVSVCTPNFMHHEATVAALEAGKHVLCEKPLAMNAREGQAMIDTAKRVGRKLTCGLNNRFRSDAQALRRFAESGYLGEVYYGRAQALRRRGIPGWGVFTRKDMQGGGPLIDIGVHILDLALFVMGHPRPIAASGKCYTKFGHRQNVVGLMGQWNVENFTVEDWGAGFIRFENGTTLSLEASFAANIVEDVFNFTLMGDRGGCQLDPLRLCHEEARMLVEVTPKSLPKVNSHEEEIRRWVECLRTDGPVPVPAEEALNVTKILDAIYESSEKGHEVAIP